ncbi:PREDICTED: uncharacterized protein LOC108768186 [Trachymyrmex cornetzi]|uniref:uncharacterized protein LOC108768186 n=1 Tax=Trachymyrmex cornetzi TaxID=471704 RepID=UPI00084ED9C4|nr:PREDICTED: uncharacterized protein LOC108768186 [Trachymyrmex cornetzi]
MRILIETYWRRIEDILIHLRITTNKRQVVTEFIKNIEHNLYKLPTEVKNQLRNKIIPLFDKINVFSNNNKRSSLYGMLKERMKVAKQFLKENQNFILTKADKGNVTVALDKNKYINSMNEILQDTSTYTVVKKSPMNTLNNGLRNILTKWKSLGYITDGTYRWLNTSDGLLPRVYISKNLVQRWAPHLPPILADIVIQDLEEKMLEDCNFDIPIYYRYVDDIIMAIPGSKIKEIQEKFNAYHPRLQFTVEIEYKNMNFLDTTIIIDNNQIKSDWYHKPLFLGRYLNYNSQHQLSQKKGTIIDNIDDFEQLLNVVGHSKDMGLNINTKKTKFMVITREPNVFRNVSLTLEVTDR